MMGEVRFTQFRSTNGANPRQRDTLRTLGLGRIGKTSARADGPALRGALQSVRHLVRLERQ